MKERLHLYAQPHPEVEEDEKAEGEDEEEEGGELVKRVVLVVKVLLHIFQAEKKSNSLCCWKNYNIYSAETKFEGGSLKIK